MRDVIITFILAMAPISEVRGAIPYALAHNIDYPWAILLPILGNVFVVPWLLLLLNPIFNWMKNQNSLTKLHDWMTRYQEKTLKKVTKHNRAILLALYLFVAVPLPSTGAYSGALAAVFLQLPKRKSFAVISLGVITAAIIVYLTSKGVIHLL